MAKLNKLKRMSYAGKERNELIKHRLTFTMNMCKKLGITVTKIINLMVKYKRLNIKNKESDLNNLNIIHITGSKGKGSTCAFIESILRNKGYKTGLIRY